MLGAALGLGSLGIIGTELTNRSNEDIASARNLMEIEEAQKARDFSAEQSQINRDFQERLSNTAVSRRMADMKGAGLNPILAGKYDASTPSGAIGATAKANAHGYDYQNPVTGALAGMTSAVSLAKEIASTRLINEQANTMEFTGAFGPAAGSAIDSAVGAAKKYHKTAVDFTSRNIVEPIANSAKWIDKSIRDMTGFLGEITGEMRDNWSRQKVKVEALKKREKLEYEPLGPDKRPNIFWMR